MKFIQYALPAALAAGAFFSPVVHADSLSWPDKSTSWVKEGVFIPPVALAAIRPGLTKDDVRNTISYPHFREGFIGVREWNYLVRFRTDQNSTNAVECQYQVQFDETNRVVSTHWKDPACEEYLKPLTVVKEVIKEVPVPAQPSMPKKIELGADALFAFNKSSLADITAGGRATLDKFADDVRRTYSRIERIAITGHADPIGSASYNQKLSTARAQTIRSYLISRGLPAAQISALGVGSTQPVVNCGGGKKTPALITCNQPNRRVTIEITGSN